MKKTYELNYGNKATLNTGNYENINPMYNIKCIIETERDLVLEEEFAKLRDAVDRELNLSINQIRQEQLIKALKHLRFYEKDGKKYPSVTSIINPEPYTADPLYGERGDLVHDLLAKDIYDYQFSQEEEVKFAPIGGIRQYTLKWIKEDMDIEFDKSEVEVFNEKEVYAGRYDKDGLYKGKLAIFDLKTGDLSKAGQEKAFLQLAAYANATSSKIEQLVILPCGPKVKSVPIVTTEIDKYFGVFMELRREFKERFGV